jgi:succinylarginine dihydrolase
MTTGPVYEVNFDCLVGPSHHFGGLSFGNIASGKNKHRPSNPKKAALQGLAKMKFLHERGFKQAIFPPHERPASPFLRELGFRGSDFELVLLAQKQMPEVFNALCSSSSMWAANAATISPSMDTRDKRMHVSPANLVSMFHRSLEHEFNYRVFKEIFPREYFVIHQALPSHDIFSDEGAANHCRLAKNHGALGLELFVYGKANAHKSQKSQIFPARQSKLACEAIIRRHQLVPENCFVIEQNPKAIDAGAFHNDVVCVANEGLLLCHEESFLEQGIFFKKIAERYEILNNNNPTIIIIPKRILSLEDAVSSYLFNSQVLTKKDNTMLLFAPSECNNIISAQNAIKEILSHVSPINEVAYFDISESMANGGGPACLRLRMVMTKEEIEASKKSVFFSDEVYAELKNIIERFYVEELKVEYFQDKDFFEKSRTALDLLARALGFKGIYSFQK